MSIVSNEALVRIKALRDRAVSSGEWENKYQWAMRSAEASIAVLEQISENTESYKIVLEKK